jgi:signal transduction histidine kinase
MPPLPQRTPALAVSMWGDHARWLVRMRWVAILGVLVTVALTSALGVITSPAPMLIVVGMLATANLVFSHYASQAAAAPGSVPWSITWQIAVDLVALALLLHYSDAVRNPFSGFYVLHVVIAGLILPWKTGARLVALAVGMQALIVVGEGFGYFEHYPLLIAGHTGGGLEQNPTFLAGHVFGLAALLSVTLYFTATTAARLRATEARRAEHERLAKSRERLARIGTLAAGVAHGVRTPLHGILSGMEALRESLEGDEESRALLDMIDERIEAIDGLTQTLLNLGRGAPILKETTRLDLVLEKAVRFVSTRAKDHQVGLTLELSGNVNAEVDADRLSEAVANLLDNAVDASARGDQVVLRLRDVADRPDAFCIEVEDHGSGIAPKDIDSVFDPFFTTKPVGRGSGLGLAITRQAVDEHGGEIEVASRFGVGTVVRLVLPRKRTEA